MTVDNEYIVRGELPQAFAAGKILRIGALPTFLKTYIDRLSFSFTDYLRSEKDSSPNCINGFVGTTSASANSN